LRIPKAAPFLGARRNEQNTLYTIKSGEKDSMSSGHWIFRELLNRVLWSGICPTDKVKLSRLHHQMQCNGQK